MCTAADTHDIREILYIPTHTHIWLLKKWVTFVSVMHAVDIFIFNERRRSVRKRLPVSVRESAILDQRSSFNVHCTERRWSSEKTRFSLSLSLSFFSSENSFCLSLPLSFSFYSNQTGSKWKSTREKEKVPSSSSQSSTRDKTQLAGTIEMMIGMLVKRVSHSLIGTSYTRRQFLIVYSGERTDLWEWEVSSSVIEQ